MSGIMDKAATLKNKLNEYCPTCAKAAIPRVDPLFQPFADLPDPAAFDAPMAEALTAMKALSYGFTSDDAIAGMAIPANPTLRNIDSVAGELTEWRGEAAESFRDNIQVPFPAVVSNLYQASAVMYGALEAEKALWTAAAKDINDIADKAISAAEALGDTGGAEGAFLISVVGAVVAVALAPITAGASVAAAVSITAVAGAFSVAGQAVQVNWDADNPNDVVNATEKGINKLKEELSNSETRIRDALKANAGLMQGGGPMYRLGVSSLQNGPGGLTGYR